MDTFTTLLWVLLGDVLSLYNQVLKLWRVLNQPLLNAVKSKLSQIRCSHISWQVLEEMKQFFYQRPVPNDFTNKGTRRFLTADLGGLIKGVRRNNLLDLVTMPNQWNNHYNGNNWGNRHGKSHGGNMQEAFLGAVPMQKGLDRYSPTAGNGTGSQTSQGRVWQVTCP